MFNTAGHSSSVAVQYPGLPDAEGENDQSFAGYDRLGAAASPHGISLVGWDGD